MQRVAIDEQQIARFAAHLQTLDDVRPFDFCGPEEGALFPPRKQPGVIDYFFFCCAHQFGFWHEEHDRYARPMIARLEGMPLKGSDFLWRCATRAWSKQEDFFTPERMGELGDDDWNEIFQDDDGHNPLPLWENNLRIIHAYTRWFRRENTRPGELVSHANGQDASLAAFLEAAGRVPGYVEDPLRKKLLLLAITLENRPEHFLRVSDPEHYEPIIDYHLQRSALRTGLVRVTDPGLERRLRERRFVADDEERDVRAAVFEAIRMLVEQSGLSVAAIDWFFFMNRKRCPEMTEPECPVCPVNTICARRTELFQPVFRTEAY